MLYSSISDFYDGIFPLNPDVVAFLGEYIRPEHEVLDIGCGTGTLTHALAGRCRHITGIDISPEMIRAGRRKHPELNLLQTEINGLKPGLFDVIFSTGNTLSYINPENLRVLVSGIAARLTNGGYWMYQTVNWDYLQHRTGYRFPDIVFASGIFKRSYCFINEEETDFHLVLEQTGGRTVRETHRLYRLPFRFVADMHAAAGFRLENVFSSWTRRPWAPDVPGATIPVYCFTGLQAGDIPVEEASRIP